MSDQASSLLTSSEPHPGDLVHAPTNERLSADDVQLWFLKLSTALLEHPGASAFDLAAVLGKRPKWVATIKNSDAFAEYHYKRTKNVASQIALKTATMVELAADRMIEKLELVGDNISTDDLNEIIDKGSRRLGFDVSAQQKSGANVSIQLGVAVGRGDLELARQKMQEKFGVVADSPALSPPPKAGSVSPSELQVTEEKLEEKILEGEVLPRDE